MPINLIKKLLFFVVVLPGIPFVLGSAVLLGYSFWPMNKVDLKTPDIDENASHVILLTHGLKDTPNTWVNDLAGIIQKQSQDEVGTEVLPLDWSVYATSAFRCSVNAVRIGKFLSEQFIALKNLQSVHLIAHSCGSFIVHSLCERLKKKKPTIQVQTTYLDPVSVYAGMQWNYGLEHFGDCADFGEAYIDREDGVPGSDQPLVNAYTFDVTNARKFTDFNESPHVWPIFYYKRLAEYGGILRLSQDKDLMSRYPKGSGETVNRLLKARSL